MMYNLYYTKKQDTLHMIEEIEVVLVLLGLLAVGIYSFIQNVLDISSRLEEEEIKAKHQKDIAKQQKKGEQNENK